MRTLIRWLKQIRNSDKGWVHLLKFLYSIGKISYLHVIITFILGIFIPISYEANNMGGFYVLIVFGILDILFATICSQYQNKVYTERKFSADILQEQSSLLKSIVIVAENKNNWELSIFKTVSDLVCEKIYHILKEVFHCETRVSVEYVFDKLNKREMANEKCIKMAARKSRLRDAVRKSQSIKRRENYYSYKIFTNNRKGINILNENEINNPKIWYKNPEHDINVKKYLGIAVSLMDEDNVNFILQIDFLDDFNFGESDDENGIKDFINLYLMSYINTISLSYLLNLNDKNKIFEV